MTVSKYSRKVRYAVVGLGHIAQAAVLPAFAHARRNSQLTALVSDDPQKLEVLACRYKVDHVFSCREYGDCLRNGAVGAVYIALPNRITAFTPRGREFTFCARNRWRLRNVSAKRCSGQRSEAVLS
jgi:hypothetical protein